LLGYQDDFATSKQPIRQKKSRADDGNNASHHGSKLDSFGKRWFWKDGRNDDPVLFLGGRIRTGYSMTVLRSKTTLSISLEIQQ
jgi:hypothetical protein